MSARTMLVVILALGCGLMAAVGIGMMKKAGPAAEVPTRPVVFVAADIRRGEPIKREMIEVRPVPRDQAPPSALASADEVVDRIARIPMLKDDAMTDAKLEPKGARSRVVPPGKRAMTITKADMPPHLEVDDHVDVLFTINGQGAGANSQVEDVLVWDVQAAAAKGDEPGAIRSVTILVDPDHANALNQGLNSGTLRLVRRNPGDPARPAVAVAPPKPPEPARMSEEIAPGMRAFTIPTPHLPPSLAQHIHPGDKLDIFFTGDLNLKGGAGDDAFPKGAATDRIPMPATSALMENVTVREIGASTFAAGPNADPSTSRFLTLLVPAEKVALLNLANQKGTLHFALRHPDDTRGAGGPVTYDDLKPEALRGVAPTVLTTRTLRGTQLGSDRLTIHAGFGRVASPTPRGVPVASAGR